MADQELIRRAWRVVLQRSEPRDPLEVAVFDHFTKRVDSLRRNHDTHQELPDERIVALLRDELTETLPYMDPTWGYVDAAAIVSRVDECAISLQEKTKREFLDPLNWDLIPHAAVVATAKAVLLLFNMPFPSHLSDDDFWHTHWALWIVKNIDAHTGGWEWVATNEPTGLFTKPYVLSARFLPQVKHLLETTRTTPDSHRCWHRMAAYKCLRDWAVTCVEYVHLRAHYLPCLPAFRDVDELLSPPRRTPQANVWFRLETAEGITYYYNRVLQEIVLTKPEDFDGFNVTAIPEVVRELINDALTNDPATRLELERRGHEKIRGTLLAEDEWVQCINARTQQPYYYSFRHHRVSDVPPASGVFLRASESVAFKAVVRLQTAYRRRRLQLKLQIKRTKRASLPVFSSLATTKKRYN